MDDTDQRILIGMTGASGQTFGATAVKLLSELPVELHLILSGACVINLRQEGTTTPDQLREMADVTYTGDSTDSPVVDQSFDVDGMIIAPCSMKTLAGVAHREETNLIARAATNQLEKNQPVVLMPREKPLNLIHLRNMKRVTEIGGTIMPPNMETSGFAPEDDVRGPVRRQMFRVLHTVGIPIE